MLSKASIIRLDPESRAALATLSKLLGRPMNKLVNEAVRDFLLKESPVERELIGTLTTLREFRARSSARHEAGRDGRDAAIVPVAQDFVKRVSRRHAVKAALLFGSRARGTHGADSDVDIAVLLQGNGGKLTEISLDMADAAYEVLLETGIYIQPLPIWEDEWEHPDTHSNPRLLENIKRDGRPL
jgi:uncharacterized protein